MGTESHTIDHLNQIQKLILKADVSMILNLDVLWNLIHKLLRDVFLTFIIDINFFFLT